MRKVLLITGFILITIGAISMITPIPGSTFLIATGSGLVICTSKRVERWIKKMRGTHVHFNNTLTWLENKMGERIGGTLKLTQPDYEPKLGDHET